MPPLNLQYPRDVQLYQNILYKLSYVFSVSSFSRVEYYALLSSSFLRAVRICTNVYVITVVFNCFIDCHFQWLLNNNIFQLEFVGSDICFVGRLFQRIYFFGYPLRKHLRSHLFLVRFLCRFPLSFSCFSLCRFLCNPLLTLISFQHLLC